jgi:adenine phosphoribosyltransferase
MARQNNESTYIIARKVVKLYMKEVFSVELRSITTDKKQTLYIDTAEAELMRGKKVLIVDDVISTGESLRAVEKLVKEAGGQVVGKMAILAEGDAKYRDDIIFLAYLPLLNSNGTPKD